MKIKILENIAIDGEHVEAGSVVDIGQKTADRLITLRRAEIVPAAKPAAEKAKGSPAT